MVFIASTSSKVEGKIEYYTYPPRFYLKRSETYNPWTYKVKIFLLYSSWYKVKSFLTQHIGCNTCYAHFETILCTISLAAGLGNIYRLPQEVFLAGGLPFLVAYIILLFLIGFPLLFLEFGIGQIVQEGPLKTWRAVPFFKGLGYIKMVAVCFLALYYPIQIALALYYAIFLSKGPPPFSECATVILTENGYSANGISGQLCLKKTFIESAFTEPTWFGIYAALIFLVWIVIIFLLFKRTRTYKKALMILIAPIIASLIYLIILASQNSEGLSGLNTTLNDWKILDSANVWYYAAIQVFFSTQVGFGVFMTNAVSLYKKSSPLLTSLGYIIMNLFFGLASTLLFYTFSTQMPLEAEDDEVREVQLLTHIYDIGLKMGDNRALPFTLVAYVLIIFAGFVSMISLVYTILKTIYIDHRRRIKWWQLLIVFSFIMFLLGSAFLLKDNLSLLHLLDHYVVGNLVLIVAVLEVFSFLCFYGSRRILSDFEFIMGQTVSKLWLTLWWLSIPLLLAFFLWALTTLPMFGQNGVDPIWLWGAGWAIVLISILFVLIMGIYNISRQDEYYNIIDKFKASVKCSRNWGPIDPIIRYNWVQWHSKRKDGERDFTLKRRGTRDYAHSVKKRSKIGKSYTPASSGVSTPASGSYNKNDLNENTITIGTASYPSSYSYGTDPKNYENPLRVTALVDTLDPPGIYVPIRINNAPGYKTNLNPLSQMGGYDASRNDALRSDASRNDESTSEGYGTFRKGPYVIQNRHIEHVCHRRLSEEATEL